MLIEMNAAEIVQALGRATRGQGTDRVIQHRIVGCRQGVAEKLRSEYGLNVELSHDLIPNVVLGEEADTKKRIIQAAWALLWEGKAVTRAAVEVRAKVGHAAYGWLVNESPLKLRLAPLLRDKGVAAQIRKGLLAAAAKLGEDLAEVLRLWAEHRTYGPDHIDGDDTEAARWFSEINRLIPMAGAPPG